MVLPTFLSLRLKDRNAGTTPVTRTAAWDSASDWGGLPH
jgi:hypothetical protein